MATQVSDGQITTAGSPDLSPRVEAGESQPGPPPPPSLSPDATRSYLAADVESLTRSAENKNARSPDKDLLQSLGMTKRAAMKLLANGKDRRWLNTRVTARVLMVHQANSVDQIELAQRRANLMGRNADIDGRTRASCLAVVAQCGMALARLSEVCLVTARNLDEPDDAGKTPVIKPIQNNFFGFPPVTTLSKQRLSSSATSGDVVEVSPVPPEKQS